MARTARLLQSLRDERQTIRKLIKKVQGQLDSIDRGLISPNAAFISRKKGKTIADLQSPHRNLKEALQHDLRALRQQLKQVRTDRRSVRREAAQQRVMASKAQLQKHIEDMHKDGVVDPQELEVAREYADRVLTGSVAVLTGNPTTRNVKLVFDALTDTQMLGAEPNAGANARAFRALAGAGAKLHANLEKQFRRTPTSKNLTKMLNGQSLAEFLGGNPETRRAGWKAAGDISHTTTNGETLSGLSKQYYGKFGYWDVIYVHNVAKIADVDHVPPGTKLVIP
jgi:nucleoid-associated protein YgaU